jgi:hypothetical protein
MFTRGKGNQDMISAFAPPYAALREPLAEVCLLACYGTCLKSGTRVKYDAIKPYNEISNFLAFWHRES